MILDDYFSLSVTEIQDNHLSYKQFNTIIVRYFINNKNSMLNTVLLHQDTHYLGPGSSASSVSSNLTLDLIVVR